MDQELVTLKRGERSVSVDSLDLEVKKIATIFKMDSDTIYLVSDNRAIFPGASGRFSPSHIDYKSDSVYEVLGDDVLPTSSRAHDQPTPFGAYHPPQVPPRPHPPVGKGRLQQTKIGKTISLVTLSLPDSSTPSTSSTLNYTVVTQTQVSIDNYNCNPEAISTLVSSIVGFNVVLLDSKCFPLLNNDVTSTLNFWKSTRKILAASKSAYETLTGKKFSGDISEDILSTRPMSPKPPSKKKKKDVESNPSSDSDFVSELKLLNKAVNKLNKNFQFIENMAKQFECVICKNTSSKPVVASCCQRIIGCEACIARWSGHSSACPHCHSQSPFQQLQLKGLDDFLRLASCMFDPDPAPCDQLQPDHGNDSSDSDFEPPRRFRRPHAPN